MKNVKKAIALVAVIMGVSTVSFAQSGFSVRAGGNFPVGTFGQGEDFGKIALNNAKAELGGAAIGFNVGAKYQLGLFGNLSAFASADFFYNGLKGVIKEAMKVEGTDVVAPAYMNIPVMVGANYTILDIIGTTLWVEAGAGVNFRNITSQSIDYSTEIPFVGAVNASAESTYNMSTTFAWQAGIGVSLSGTVSLGLHYYGFGSAPISYETAIDAGASNLGSLAGILGEDGSFNGGKLNPSMVVIRLGYHF